MKQKSGISWSIAFLKLHALVLALVVLWTGDTVGSLSNNHAYSSLAGGFSYFEHDVIDALRLSVLLALTFIVHLILYQVWAMWEWGAQRQHLNRMMALQLELDEQMQDAGRDTHHQKSHREGA